MKNFKSNKKVVEKKNELKKEQAKSNIIAFRLNERFLIPTLDKVAEVANLSRTCAAQEIVKDFLVKYNRKTIKASETAKELNLPEPSPLEPFIDSYKVELQIAAYFRQKKSKQLLEELSQTDSEVVSND